MKDDDYLEASECLKVLAHPVRLKIISLLERSELTVGEIAESLSLKSHVTSEHLRLMLRCGFLNSQRSGRNISYSVKEKHILTILECIKKRFGKTNENNQRQRL